MNDGFSSLEQLKEALEMRCEIEFTLNGRNWLLEPDQDAPDLSSNLQLVCNDEGMSEFLVKFTNANDFLNYKIGDEKMKDLWHSITNTYW